MFKKYDALDLHNVSCMCVKHNLLSVVDCQKPVTKDTVMNCDYFTMFDQRLYNIFLI